MNVKTLFVFCWASLVATAAIAGEEHRTRIEIEVDDDASGQQSFRFDSKDSGFSLHDMAVGETRVITGESGETAQVTRTDEGFSMEVNGETIDLGSLDEPRGPHSEHKMRKEKKIRMVKTDGDDGVTIISGETIDETTRQRIREVLESSGQGGDVVFIDGSELETAGAHSGNGHREVRVIKLMSGPDNPVGNG